MYSHFPANQQSYSLSYLSSLRGGRGSPGRLVSQRGLWCHDMALCIFMIFLHSLERPSRRMLLQIPPPINQRRNHSGLWPKVGMTLIMLAMRPNCPCPWPTGTGRTVCRQRSSVCGQSSQCPPSRSSHAERVPLNQRLKELCLRRNQSCPSLPGSTFTNARNSQHIPVPPFQSSDQQKVLAFSYLKSIFPSFPQTGAKTIQLCYSHKNQMLHITSL